MTVLHYAGVLLVLTLIAGIGIYSGKKVKNAADFSTGGGKAGAWIVAGTIMGTLVSGQATIGTAQLAFTYGMSAWWFTLGAGIGCLILAVGYAVPLRRSEQTTLLSIISKEYGNQAGAIGSVLCRHLCQCNFSNALIYGAAYNDPTDKYVYGAADCRNSYGGLCNLWRRLGRRDGRRYETNPYVCCQHI